MEQVALENGCRVLRLTTTNDNLPALRFYQKRGFVLHRLLPGAVERSREIKPEIPLLGVDTLEDLPPGNWALVREAQLQTLQVPHTAMAVAIDVGEANDLHPQNKRDVALRLFLAARRLVFGEPVAAQGPLYARMERENGALKVFFTGVEGGLRAKGGELKWFEVCGADGVFHPARAGIQGEAVRVWSESVPDPRGVRYAWHDNPEGANLYNAKGLPASPFRARLAEDTSPA